MGELPNYTRFDKYLMENLNLETSVYSVIILMQLSAEFHIIPPLEVKINFILHFELIFRGRLYKFNIQ